MTGGVNPKGLSEVLDLGPLLGESRGVRANHVELGVEDVHIQSFGVSSSGLTEGSRCGPYRYLAGTKRGKSVFSHCRTCALCV